MNTVQSKKLFIEWVKKTRPDVYARAMPRAAGLSGMGETAAQILARQNGYGEIAVDNRSQFEKLADTFIDTVSKLAPTVIQTSQANKIMKINLELARQGKPPIDTTSYSPQFNVGIPKDVQYILWGALAIGAIFVISKARK